MMSALLIQEHHLWLNMAEMKEAEKVTFLNAPISQAGLFGDTVEDFSQHFLVVRKQIEAIKHILPQWDAAATRPPRTAPPSARH